MKTIGVKGIINPMSDNEMKLVKGGAGMNNNGTLPLELYTGHEADPADDSGDGGDGKCIATYTLDESQGYHCFYGIGAAAQAENYAGINGWWCCNCADAQHWCYSVG